MKTTPVFALILRLAAFTVSYPQTRPEWNDPAVTQVNREKIHASLMVYPSAALARDGIREKSPWFHSLSGNWRFHIPAAQPHQFRYRLTPIDGDYSAKTRTSFQE